MVMNLHRNAHLLENQAHLRANILERVHWWHWKIAPLHRRPMSEITTLVFDSSRPAGFLGFDFHTAARHIDRPGDPIKNKEFGLWPKVRCITHPT